MVQIQKTHHNKGGPHLSLAWSLVLQITHYLTTMGLSLAQVTCETSKVLQLGGQVAFLGDLPFWLHLR